MTVICMYLSVYANIIAQNLNPNQNLFYNSGDEERRRWKLSEIRTCIKMKGDSTHESKKRCGYYIGSTHLLKSSTHLCIWFSPLLFFCSLLSDYCRRRSILSSTFSLRIRFFLCDWKQFFYAAYVKWQDHTFTPNGIHGILTMLWLCCLEQIKTEGKSMYTI